jgi:hypothetical protein
MALHLLCFKYGSLCQEVLSHCLCSNTDKSRKTVVISRSYVDGRLLCSQDKQRLGLIFFFGLRPLPFPSSEIILFRISAPSQPLTWRARVPIPVVQFAQKLFCMDSSNRVQAKAGIACNKILAALNCKWKQVDSAARHTFLSRRNRKIRLTI